MKLMAIFPTTLLVAMLLQISSIDSRIVHSRPVTYKVGGEEGWDLSISMQAWARGKRFHAGDYLVFEYDDQRFNVVLVNKQGFESCTAGDDDEVLDSGNDRVQLHYGGNYFIDSEASVCAAGMKMAIDATSPHPSFEDLKYASPTP